MMIRRCRRRPAESTVGVVCPASIWHHLQRIVTGIAWSAWVRRIAIQLLLLELLLLLLHLMLGGLSRSAERRRRGSIRQPVLATLTEKLRSDTALLSRIVPSSRTACRADQIE